MSYIGWIMDSVTTERSPEVDDRFDSARINAAVDAIAQKYEGHEDVFRSTVAQLLKAELVAQLAKRGI